MLRTNANLDPANRGTDASHIDPGRTEQFRHSVDGAGAQPTKARHRDEPSSPDSGSAAGVSAGLRTIELATLPTIAPAKDYGAPNAGTLGADEHRPIRSGRRSFVAFDAPRADREGVQGSGELPPPSPAHSTSLVDRPEAARALVEMTTAFGRDLDAGRVKPENVQADELAQLLEQVRAYRIRPGQDISADAQRPPEKDYSDGRGVTKDIDDATLKRLLSASGWSDGDIAAFQAASFGSGVYNAVLPQLLNNVSLTSSSFVAAAVHEAGPWVRAVAPFVNIAFSLVVTPPLVGVAKMRTSPMAEDHRLRGAPQMKLDKSEIGAKNWPSRFAKTVHAGGKSLNRDAQAFSAELRRVLGEVPSPDRLLTPEEIRHLKPAAEALQRTAAAGSRLKEELLVAQAYHGYNEAGNFWQQFTRTERPTGSALTKLVSSKDEAYPGFVIPERGSPHAISPFVSPALGTTNSLLNLGAGVTAAMYDELGRQNTQLKLNFAFSYAFFKSESREAIRLGKKIEASDIDVATVASLRTYGLQAVYETAMKRIDADIRVRQSRIGTPEARPEDDADLARLTDERGRMQRKDFGTPREDDHLTVLLRAESKGLVSRWWDSQSLLGAAIDKRRQSGDFWTQLTQNYTQAIGGGIGSLTTNSLPGFVSAAVGSAKLNPAIVAAEAVGIAAASGTNSVYYAGNVNAKDSQRANKEAGTPIGGIRQFIDGSFLYLNDAAEGSKNVANAVFPTDFVTQRSAHRVMNEALRLAKDLLPLARQIAPLPADSSAAPALGPDQGDNRV